MTPVDSGAAVTEVQREVASLTGAAVLDATRLDGGASRTGWRMRLDGGDGTTQDVYVRVGNGSAGAVARMYDVAREAGIVRDVATAGVPAPAVMAVSKSMPLAVMEFIHGTSEFDRLHAVRARRGVERQYLAALRQLHGLDVRQVTSLADGAADSIGDATARDLEVWRQLSSADGVNADPLVHLAEQWLSRNVSAADEPARIVHGDAGPGNFMFHNGRLAALVDWELAHVGDPVEDLGWILLRAGDAPLDELRTWVALFARVSRLKLSAEALQFHRILALYKTTVAISSSASAQALTRPSHLLQLLTLYRYLLGWLLANALGIATTVAMPAADAVPVTGPVTQLAVEGSELLERSLDAGSMDASSKLATRRARLILGFFARREALWPAASDEICRNAAELLGGVPSSVEQMLVEIRPLASLNNQGDAALALRLLVDLEQRRLSLWPGLPRRAIASCRRSDELIDGGAA